jgi:hypothetical protein
MKMVVEIAIQAIIKGASNGGDIYHVDFTNKESI